MRCPVCIEPELVMSERQGIEIDYCPQCRGVWLDRGELDKIIERSASLTAPSDSSAGAATQPLTPLPSPIPAPDRPRRDHYDDDYDRGYGDHRKKKRKNFLEDLFDFG
jgi:uncharacterized protein